MADSSGLITRPAPAPFPFGPPDVASVLDAGVAAHPERLALIDRHQRREWTWSELDQRVDELASGVVAGRPYVLGVRDDADKILAALAILRAGAVVVFSSRRSLRLDTISASFGTVEELTSLADITPGAGSPSNTIDPLAPAAIAATSGTSGVPKLVVHSQHNLVLPGLVSIDVDPPTPDERVLTPLDPAILNVMVLAPLAAFLRGSTLVLPNKAPNGPNWKTALRSQDVTRLVVVPPQLRQLILSATDPTYVLPALRRVLVGGAGSDPDLVRSFMEQFGVRPTPSYGLTEAPTGVVRASLDDPIEARRGFALPHVTVSVHAPDGSELPVGEEGQICVSPTVEGTWARCWTPALGYLGDPAKAAATFVDGTLLTGDKGVIDEHGALSVTGRLSDVIIRGGMNLDPIEIAAVLQSHPEVGEAIVVGIEDDRLGERIGVLLTRRSGSVDPADLRSLVRERLSPHHVPDVIVSAQGFAGKNEMGKAPRHLPPALFSEGDRNLRTVNLQDGTELRPKARPGRPRR